MRKTLLILCVLFTVFMANTAWASELTTFPLTSGQTWINTATNTKYTVSGTAGNLTLTASVANASTNGGTATIADQAFYNTDLAGLKSIVVSEGITSIGSYFCYNGQNVEFTSLSLPASLITISNNAFYTCSSLTTVTIANGSNLQTIDAQAFNNAGVTTINLGVCTKLTSIGGWAFNKVPLNGALNLSGCTQLTSIGRQAFDQTSITSLNLPASLKSIEMDAFRDCKSLTAVNIASGSQLQTISITAFSGSNISSINLDNCTQLTNIGNKAFYNTPISGNINLSGCTQLTTIGEYAFAYCGNMTGVSLPKSLTTLKANTFLSCSNLANVTIANGSQLTSIESDVFFGCQIPSIALPCAGLTSIGRGSLGGASSPLQSVYCLTESAITVDSEVFEYYHNKATVYMLASKKVDWPGAKATKVLFTVAAGEGINNLSGTPVYGNYYTEGSTVNIITTVADPRFLVNDIECAASGSGNNYSVTMPTGITTDVVTLKAVSRSISVNYIDASGNQQTTNAIVLIGNENSLDGGWYVVNSNITRSSRFQLNGETHIILADGCTLNMGTADSPINGNAISGTTNLNIYGQSNQSGQLNITCYGNYAKGIDVNTYRQNGGDININTTSPDDISTGINANNLVEINRGKLTINSDYFGIKIAGNINNRSYLQRGGNVTLDCRVFGLSTGTNDNNNVDILGGTFISTGTEEYGIYAEYKTVTFGWTSATDYMLVNKFGRNTNTQIAAGQYFTDGTNIYSGVFTDNIDGKTMRPTPFTSGTGTADDPWVLSSVDGWNLFCDCLLDNDTWNGFSGKTVKLGADISIERAAGSAGHEFMGTFDGDYHTLTVNITETTTQGTAPFREIKGATIKNVITTGSVNGTAHAAGLVGFARGDASVTNNIENCKVGANVTVTTADHNGNYHCGGVVGHAIKSNLNISNTVYCGAITNSGNHVGGLQGWCDGNTITLNNCLFTGSYSGGGVFHPVAVRNKNNATTATVTNTFYTVLPTQTDAAYIAADGKKTTGNANIPINLGNQVEEINFMTVYEGGMLYDGLYYAAPTLTTDSDGAYLINIINNATDWDMFCDALQDNDTWNRFSGKTVKLGADISVTRMAGSANHDFCGTFDGQCHTLTFTSTENTDGVAPFSYISETTPMGGSEVSHPAIHNLNVIADITTTATHASGLVGRQWGAITIEGCTVGGTITTSAKYAAGFIGQQSGTADITDCVSSITIQSSVEGDGTHGGFVAIPSNTLNITGCLFNGKVITTNGTTSCGGFVGWHNGKTVTVSNSLYAPAAIADDENAITTDCATFVRGWSGTPANSYYTVPFGTAQGKQAHSITGGENVTVAASGDSTVYDVSGITAYDAGFMRDSVFFAGEEDEVLLALTYTGDGVLEGFTASAGTLAGTANPYTLTMPAEDVVISATASPAGMPGDANGDGKVDVNDVTTVINYILGKNPTPFNYDNANVNGDSQVDVMDVTLIINIILGIQ